MKRANLIQGYIVPEFGNPDHIKLIKAGEQWAEDFKTGQVDIYDERCTIDVTVSLKFECPCCGNYINEDFTYDDAVSSSTDIDDVMRRNSRNDHKFKCYTCKSEFAIINQKELVLKRNTRELLTN